MCACRDNACASRVLCKGPVAQGICKANSAVSAWWRACSWGWPRSPTLARPLWQGVPWRLPAERQARQKPEWPARVGVVGRGKEKCIVGRVFQKRMLKCMKCMKKKTVVGIF